MEKGLVNGWDDPRLSTLNGLRRRGVTPVAINDFVDRIGVTRRGNENFISYQLLEHCVRKDLDENAPRTLAVVEPIKVLIEGMEPCTVEASLYPRYPARGTYLLSLSNVIYIEFADFLENDRDDYFGLAPGKVVGLKYLPFKLKCLAYEKSGDKVTVIRTQPVFNDDKPKGMIHWISEEDAVECEIRLYSHLFKSPDPASLDDWTADIDPESLVVKSGCFVNKALAAKEEDRFQFERVGFFVVDKDSTAERTVFNRIVTLSEGKKKKVN